MSRGVCYSNGVLFIADTYNSKIKRIDPTTKETTSLIGGPESGFRDGTWDNARLNEPSGVSCANGALYIADTNNHAIRVANLGTGRGDDVGIAGIVRQSPYTPCITHSFLGILYQVRQIMIWQ